MKNSIKMLFCFSSSHYSSFIPFIFRFIIQPTFTKFCLFTRNCHITVRRTFGKEEKIIKMTTKLSLTKISHGTMTADIMNQTETRSFTVNDMKKTFVKSMIIANMMTTGEDLKKQVMTVKIFVKL